MEASSFNCVGPSFSNDASSHSNVERAKYRGHLKHLALSGFLSDLVCMKDVLRELCNLSLKLQKHETSLVDASCHIEQTIDVVRVMKERGGGGDSRQG